MAADPKPCNICGAPLTAEMIKKRAIPVGAGRSVPLFAKSLPVLWCSICDRAGARVQPPDVVQ